MRKTILFILFFITTISFAQTKVIAHKSHSGSKSTFSKAYNKNLFDIRNSNFGLPTHHIVILDTVIAIDKSHSILKMRISIDEYTEQQKSNYKNLDNYKNLGDSKFRYKTKIISDSLFNKNNSVDYIKLAPPYRYPIYFVNPIGSVVFIGFKKPF